MSATETGYRTPARLLHWTMAVIVLMMIPAGFVMVQEGIDRLLQDTLFIFHKNGGLLLLLLVVVRTAYRWRHPAPPLPASVPAWQQRIAGASHVALYVLLFAMPVLGYVRVKAGGFPLESLDALGVPSLVPRSDALANTAKGLHLAGALAFTVLLAAHIGAALQHGLLRRDGVFTRMWPPVARRKPT